MRILLVLLLLSISFKGNSQEYMTQHLETISLMNEKFLGVDSFNAIYTSSDRTLYKSNQTSTVEYAALNLGPITNVDLINPLKIVVFYKLTNTVVILDNTLNEITRINFSNLDNPKNISHASNAGDRRLWIFNTDLQQLELFDYRQLNVLIEFQPIGTIPKAIASDFNFCWVQNENKLLTYTIYGSLAGEEQLTEKLESILKADDFLIGIIENQLFLKELNKEGLEPLKIGLNAINGFSLIGRKLYIYDGQNLLIYSIKSPK